MGFLCAPKGPAKGERLRAQPRPPTAAGRRRSLRQPRLRRGGLRPDQRASRPPPTRGSVQGASRPHTGACAGGKPPPAGRSGVAGTSGAAAEVAGGDLPCGRPRTLHQPAEIMRMPAKKCEIVSKPAAICEKPDLLIV